MSKKSTELEKISDDEEEIYGLEEPTLRKQKQPAYGKPDGQVELYHGIDESVTSPERKGEENGNTIKRNGSVEKKKTDEDDLLLQMALAEELGFSEDGMPVEVSSLISGIETTRRKSSSTSLQDTAFSSLDILEGLRGKELRESTKLPTLSSSMITRLAENERMEGLIDQIKLDPTSLGKYIEKNMEIDPELFELVEDHMSILQDLVLGPLPNDGIYDEEAQETSNIDNCKTVFAHGSGAKNNPVCLDDDDSSEDTDKERKGAFMENFENNPKRKKTNSGHREIVVSLIESEDELPETYEKDENDEILSCNKNKVTEERKMQKRNRKSSVEDNQSFIRDTQKDMSLEKDAKECNVEVSIEGKTHDALLQDFLEHEGTEFNLIEQEQTLLFDQLRQRNKDELPTKDKLNDDENPRRLEGELENETQKTGIETDDNFKKGSNKENYEKKREISESDQRALDRLLELGQGAFDRKEVLRAYDMAKRNETDAASLLFLGEF